MSPYKDPEKRKQQQKIYSRRHYEKHREEVKAKTRQRQIDLIVKFKEYKKTLICENCGEERWYCLCFHHNNPDEKKDTIAQLVSRQLSWENILKEIKKCKCLCLNCHAELHHLGDVV